MIEEATEKKMEQEGEKELLGERWELSCERVEEILSETNSDTPVGRFFSAMAGFLKLIIDEYEFVGSGDLKKATLEELKEHNHNLYADILPDHYEESFANPTYAVKELGEEYGKLFSFLYVEMRSMIGFAYEQDLEELVIRAELFLEVYGAYMYEVRENQKEVPAETIREILYWFASDYADMAAMKRTSQLVTQDTGFAANIIRDSDLSKPEYLFYYGEYVTDNEVKMAEYMAALSEETIATMADTYTEGYRIGFVVTGKDLSKKKIVDVRYRLGFERMIQKALANFEKMGLKPSIYRAGYSILYNPSIFKTGYYGAEANRQCDFDHKDDKALFLDKNYIQRRLEVSKTAFEQLKKEALEYAGPAVVETFGEENFEPVNKEEAVSLSKEQNSLWLEYRMKAGELQRNYILEEERSFTIIAFPVPDIGEIFEELFAETIRINTLDYKLYQGIQQTIINALDRARYCEIKGMGENRTMLRVSLRELTNPEKETIFENCVADVNIPVGEVFTSPVLKGTEGVLHVSKVYLNGLEYKNLAITFEDGMIRDYTCENFEKEEENQAFIKENILFRHETLPMGEFAIGTNTTAYSAAKRLKVEDKLPILIAEKMGPHFAVGDTCYSHAEDIKVYNPDGKEIIARDNEMSLLRNTKPEKAYFNCHTDITIPYEELEELCAVCEDGSRIPIIRGGRFVLPGTEILNEELDS